MAVLNTDEGVMMSEHTADLMADLEISQDLEKEFSEQASRFASWGLLKVQADAEVRRLEEAEELMFSRLYAAYISNNKDRAKLIKENEVKSWIRKHPKYREAQAATRQAQQDADTLKIALQAFQQRGSMLQQMGPMFRQERDLMQVPNFDVQEKMKRRKDETPNTKRADKQHRTKRAAAALKAKRG